MRKIILILPLLLFSVSATAEEKERSGSGRDFYAGVYVVRPYVQLTAVGLHKSELNATGWMPGFSIGSVLNNGIGVGLELNTMLITVETADQNDVMQNANLMLDVAWGREFFGFVRLYASAGVGPSVWFNKITFPNAGGTGDISETTYRLNIGYQVDFGAAFIMTDRFDLDFNVKLQNLGRVENSESTHTPVFEILGDITQIEFRLGVIYKFGIW